jgi:hypothetical protein
MRPSLLFRLRREVKAPECAVRNSIAKNQLLSIDSGIRSCTKMAGWQLA